MVHENKEKHAHKAATHCSDPKAMHMVDTSLLEPYVSFHDLAIITDQFHNDKSYSMINLIYWCWELPYLSRNQAFHQLEKQL
jgi:hypothetical protein